MSQAKAWGGRRLVEINVVVGKRVAGASSKLTCLFMCYLMLLIE